MFMQEKKRYQGSCLRNVCLWCVENGNKININFGENENGAPVATTPILRNTHGKTIFYEIYCFVCQDIAFRTYLLAAVRATF